MLAVAIPVIYFATIVGQVQTTAVTEIAYQGPATRRYRCGDRDRHRGEHRGRDLLTRGEAGKSDQRDKDINRFGEYVGGIVLSVCLLVPFGLAMAEGDYFWIANVDLPRLHVSAIAARP